MRSPLLFSDGWGSDEAIEAARQGFPPAPSPAAAVDWQTETRQGDIRVTDGSFYSPCEQLPESVRTVAVRRLAPDNGAPLRDLPVCILGASSREQGFALRERCLLPIVQEGVQVVLLENAYYGLRSAPDREPGDVRTLAEQLAMARSAVSELSALVAAHRSAGHPRVAVAGFSMAGFAALFCAIADPEPLAVSAVAAGGGADYVYARSLLSDSVDWPALARDGDCTEAEARLRMERELAFTELSGYAAPADPSLVHLVGFSRDGYVPPSSTRALHRAWPGSHAIEVSGGHGSAMLWNRRHMQAAVRRATLGLG